MAAGSRIQNLEKGRYTSLEAVGQAVGGVTRERVRQIEAEVLLKLASFAEAELGHPPESPDDLLKPFARGPRRNDLADFWRQHRRKR